MKTCKDCRFFSSHEKAIYCYLELEEHDRHRDVTLDKFACVSFKTADAPLYQANK